MASWDWDKSADEEDVATLEPFSEVEEHEVLKLILPDGEQRQGRIFRCCRQDTFQEFCKSSKLPRWAHAAGGSETLCFLATPLVAVDMLEYDVDFVLRLIADSDRPLVLHVSQVQRIQPECVKDPVDGVYQDHRQQVVVNLYHLAEAQLERRLWRTLDDAMSSLSHGRCPLGHQLRAAIAPVPWVCDGCERHFTRAARPHRCLKGCDFDLCDICTSRETARADDATLTQFQQALDDLKAASLGSELPRTPPRESHWDSTQNRSYLSVSNRVTKWNAVTLSAPSAARLRQAFLAACGVDEASPAWNDFRPGAGMPVRRSKHGSPRMTMLLGRPVFYSALVVIVASWAVWLKIRYLRPPAE